MSDRRKDLRPREKLQARGVEALSDYELLMAIIGSGNAQADVTKKRRNCVMTRAVHQLPFRGLAFRGSFATINSILTTVKRKD